MVDKCLNCGADIKPDYKFCLNCGKAINNEIYTQPYTQQPMSQQPLTQTQADSQTSPEKSNKKLTSRCK